MIHIRNRATQKSMDSSTNAAISEIESLLNKMSICRSVLSNPITDYFRFDKDEGKLYLVSIEGNEYEVTITAV